MRHLAHRRNLTTAHPRRHRDLEAEIPHRARRLQRAVRGAVLAGTPRATTRTRSGMPWRPTSTASRRITAKERDMTTRGLVYRLGTHQSVAYTGTAGTITNAIGTGATFIAARSCSATQRKLWAASSPKTSSCVDGWSARSGACALRSRRSHISKATLSIKASPSSRVRLTSEQTQSISRFLCAKPPRSGAASAVSPTSFSPTPRRGQAQRF